MDKKTSRVLIIATIVFVVFLWWFGEWVKWIEREGYDTYILYGFMGLIALAAHIWAFAKFGWKAIFSPILPVYFVLAVLTGTLYAGEWVARQTNNFVGILVFIALFFGFAVLMERLSDRQKAREKEGNAN